MPGSEARYLPFGGYRAEPASGEITDRGFTGHRHNDELGLIYMQARYYVPYIYRMLTPDAIVPDYTNPQSFNRYSYARNNPVNFTDPTGHRECEFDEYCLPPPAPLILGSPLVIFFGEVWTVSEQAIVIEATNRVAGRMASAINSQRRFASRVSGTEPTGYSALSAEDTFLGVFDGPITMYKTSEQCTVAKGCIAWVNSGETTVYINRISNPYLIVHEIFHILDLTILGGAANRALAEVQDAGIGFPDRPNLDGQSDYKWGFAGPNYSNWQKSRSGLPGEEFADMGIGWVYQRWERSLTGVGWSPEGQSRAVFMSVNMAHWINNLVS